jgi:hypothetical protein
LRNLFKKVNKSKSSVRKSSFVFTDGFEDFFFKLDLDIFYNKLKPTKTKSSFIYECKNDHPYAQSYFNQDRKQIKTPVFDSLLYFLGKNNEFSRFSFFGEILPMSKKVGIKFFETKVTTKSFNEDLTLRNKNDFFKFFKNRKRIFYF